MVLKELCENCDKEFVQDVTKAWEQVNTTKMNNLPHRVVI